MSTERQDVLTAYLRAMDHLLERDGYELFSEEGLDGWVRATRDQTELDWINPAFDPAVTGPHDDGLWVGLRHGTRLVSTFASRRFDRVAGYYDRVRQGLIWSNAPRPIDIEIKDSGPSGTIGSSGGHWVHPDHRGNGLSWAVPRYGQALAQRLWSTDFIAGMVTAGVNSGRIPANYGAAATRLMVDGFFWPMNREMRVYATEYPADFVARRAAADLRSMVEEPHKKVRDFAPVVSKRKQQASV